jgi:kynurenine formamidase
MPLHDTRPPRLTFALLGLVATGGTWAVECVADLAQFPPAGATAFVGAIKVAVATGGPARVLALW